MNFGFDANLPETLATKVVAVMQPQSQSVDVGANMDFTVTAVGTPPLNYQWLKDGQKLVNATNAIYSIFNVQANAARTYSGVVSSTFGSTTSSNATLISAANACALR